MDFFELITNPKWVRRKIIVSLLINNSSSGCDTKRVTCRPNILSDKSEAFSKEKLVPLKFWSILEELDLGQEKTCTRKVFLSIETVHISLVPFYRKKSRRLSVPACKYSLPSGAYSLSSILKLFRYSKFITGLLPPSLLDTGNRLLRYELLHDDTGCIAPFNKIC